MKLNFQKDLKKVLKSKMLMYVIMLIAVMNVYNLYMSEKYQTIALFLVTVLVMLFVNKNLSIVILSSIIITYVLKKYVIKFSEGMEDEEEEKEEKEEEEEEEEEVGDDMDILAPGPKSGSMPASVNQKLTRSAGMKQLDAKGVKKLTNDAKNYADKTEHLMKKVEKFEPLIGKAEEMMDAIDTDKMESMIDSLQNSLKSMGLGGKKK